MNVLIKPTKLHGDVIIPPSKSLSHRAIIAAGLAEGKSVISNVMYSADILATIEAMEAMGADIKKLENSLIINGCRGYRKHNVIDANESGSTIRFMIPIALTVDEPITFIGKNNLVNRPLDAYYNIFDMQKISYHHGDTYLPLEVNGGLKAGVFEIPGDVSSQYITGLLYALPLLKGDSIIKITTNLESKGYVDLTLDMLSKFGIAITNNNYEEFIIKGDQAYKPCNYTIEGDYSQSAFFLVAGAFGNDITLHAMNPNSLQGDKKIIKDLEAFGCEIITGVDTLKVGKANLKGTTIDFSQSPDLGPALSVLAALSNGSTEFINAGRLRIKECDRITCVAQELRKMGVEVIENPNGMVITGVDRLNGAQIDSHNDHRLAMAFAMAATVSSSPIRIINAQCVKKSFPSFWSVYEALGGSVLYEE